MASREQLETALKNAHRAGDERAARRLARAIQAGEFDQPQESAAPGQVQATAQPEQDSGRGPLADIALEGMAAFNRGATRMADFLTTDQINAVSEILGSEFRAPSITEATSEGTQGNFMEEGLGRDVVRGAGELAAPGAVGGQVFRSTARVMDEIPAAVRGSTDAAGRQIQNLGRLRSETEGVAAGAARQMGSSRPVQDISASAASGGGAVVGGEVGESAGGDTGRQVGEFVGSLAAPIAATGAPQAEAVRRGFRGAEQGRKRLSDAVADFAEIGATPTVGQGTEDGFRRGIETLSGRILGGGPIRQAINETSDRMQSRLRDIAGDISPVSGQVETGRVIQKGITGDDGFIKRFNQKGGELWRNVDSQIGESAPSDIRNTREALESMVRDDGFSQMLNNPTLTGLRKAIDSTLGKTRINNVTQTRETVSTIPYRDLRSLRSSVGEMLSSRDLISDVPRAQLKRLYAALSQDTRDVAERAGASQAFSRANNFTRSGHKRVDDFVERVADKVDLDRVYQAVARGGEGVQSLNAIKRSLKKDEWEAVASNVIRNLGKSTPGQQDAEGGAFSVNRFLTDWNRLGESKKVLFSGSDKLNQYRENLNRIARSAERFKESAQEMANPSGTGQFVANVGILTSGGAALGTGNLPTLGLILGGVSANQGAARLMTNPRFVKWLARGTEVDDWPSHIAALNGIAKAEGLEPEVAEFMETMKEASPRQIPRLETQTDSRQSSEQR